MQTVIISELISLTIRKPLQIAIASIEGAKIRIIFGSNTIIFQGHIWNLSYTKTYNYIINKPKEECYRGIRRTKASGREGGATAERGNVCPSGDVGMSETSGTCGYPPHPPHPARPR